jgi:glycosyltransferase involved in cell wall biosynthesis
MSNLPFDVAYFDVNDEMREDYSITPNRYGGGRCVAASFLDLFDNFHIYGPAECFKNVREEKKSQCFVLDDEQRKALREGELVEAVVGWDVAFYSLFLHHFSNIHLTTKVPTLVWPVGFSEPIHPLNKYIALFDKDNQSPRFFSNDHSIFDVVIGPRMPKFEERVKEDLIINIGRITPSYQSIQVAQLAHKYQIPMIFAGPLDEGNEYGNKFMKYVDNDLVRYLGIVDHKTKLELFERAKLTTQMMDYNISVTLSCKEAMARGVIPIAAYVGQYKTFIQNGRNGFSIKFEEDFIEAWNNRNRVRQIDCYNSVLIFDEVNMLKSFLKALEIIISSS